MVSLIDASKYSISVAIGLATINVVWVVTSDAFNFVDEGKTTLVSTDGDDVNQICKIDQNYP